ncbi:FecCD family ABC transporter permease [Rhodobacter maris]|uniref:Iron complex transport system permease protein n=1 Tax=Rhodobacter maris TaxID=446682 RepID=A0A285RJ10_9RHOB|nr:iron ABC transporter permease [Rhodobacter maris]SOB93659.1 iron complex transport system permease protein [Rhodobacter maris]
MTPARLYTLLGILVAGLFLAALLTGVAAVDPVTALRALMTGGEGPVGIVMREIRLPRALLAAMVGACLGLSGAALQGLLRNPMAEPGVIGISAAAGLGAVLALQTGLAAAYAFALPAAALVGALAGVGAILFLAGAGGGTLALILAGIALSALCSAATALVLNLSPNPFAAQDIVFWMMGSLADVSFTHVLLAAPLMALGAFLLWRTGPGLEALTLGEEAAASMGVNLARLRLSVVLGTAAAVGAATAVAGTVGFVGLVVPHVLRPLVNAHPSRLLPAAALGGAGLVLAADIAVRLVLPGQDLKIGVLLALVGAPVFLHLIWRMRGAA